MKLIQRFLLSVGILTILTFTFLSFQTPVSSDSKIPLNSQEQWVDSVYQAMSLEERIGQLMMIRVHSNWDKDKIRRAKQNIENNQVGAICFFQGSPDKQVKLTNELQALTKRVPLLVAIDGEWGLGMRMKATTMSFPRQMTLGAIQDNHVIYDMGQEIARQLRRVGVQVNFAPVADINNNPENPVINTRSFGEDRYNVAVKTYMYMKGMQDHDVLACAKHFPGHGDTDVDSHLDLPIINFDRERLDSIELFPFRVLADKKVGSMMVAHLNVPALDERANRPTTLSQSTVTGLLRGELGYDGLLFTDALDMKGVTKYFGSGEVEAEALRAGNDMLVLPEDVPAAIETIKKYLEADFIPEAQLETSVKRILRTKYELGLTEVEVLEEDNVLSDLNTKKAEILNRKLYAHAMTLVRNQNDLLPFQDVNQYNLASISIGAKGKPAFQERLSSYKDIQHFQAGKNIGADKQRQLVKAIENKDAVIVSLHDMSSYASRDYGLTATTKSFIEALNEKTDVILVVFGTPYSLQYFDEVDWVLEAYEENEITQDLAAQALFGGIGLSGRLPITASPKSQYGMGVETRSNFRLGYAIPEEVGLSSDTLALIGDLMKVAIDSAATPGAVVLVAKEGKVVFHEAFGHHTYKKRRPMKKDDIFDLASVTKIASATLSVMRLQEEGKIVVDDPISQYLPAMQATNKAQIPLKDIMAHRAGLTDWIPFFEQTVTTKSPKGKPLKKYYKRQAKGNFTVPVTDRLYMRNDFVDSIWYQIRYSDLRDNTDYKYSDLGFYMIADIVNHQTGLSIDEYAQKTFYQPLGLQTMTYNPRERFTADVIAPTEEDRYFRQQKLQGHVHDMGAAMLGGVSGHAGLFSNATDLAVVLQMVLQKGHYAGKQYLKGETIDRFTQRHPKEKRRGIGFDMKQLDPNESLNMSEFASDKAFGHLGFTGIAAWVDPEHDMIYIFLSNRTYPSMKNYLLGEHNYRPRVQDIVYRALME